MVASYRCEAGVFLTRVATRPRLSGFYRLPPTGVKRDRKGSASYETKGQHLEGNNDTTYKQKLIKTLEEAYRNATPHGTMDSTAPNNKTMSFRILFEESWRETVNETIADAY